MQCIVYDDNGNNILLPWCDRSDTVTGCLSVSFYTELPGHQHTLTDWTEKKETTNILREDHIYISLHRCSEL